MTDTIREAVARAIHGAVEVGIWEDFLDEACAILSALEAEGFAVVPREPTDWRDRVERRLYELERKKIKECGHCMGVLEVAGRNEATNAIEIYPCPVCMPPGPARGFFDPTPEHIRALRAAASDRNDPGATAMRDHL